MNPSIYGVSPCNKAKDQGFPLATIYTTPGHFERNQKENT